MAAMAGLVKSMIVGVIITDCPSTFQVAGLASRDKSDHMAALQQLALFLAAPGKMEELSQASTADELCALLEITPSTESSSAADDNAAASTTRESQ
jgi:hypothetical protein